MYNKSDIQTYAEIIAEKINPNKIILFGSYAYGNPTEKSDIDLLVIKNADGEISLEEESEYSYLIYKERRKRGLSVKSDVFYRTQSQAEEIAKNGGAFADALKKGEVLYECINS